MWVTPCRANSVNENLELWEKMNDTEGFQPGEAVLRVKTDMTLKNPALRDWPAARIQTNPHPRVGDKWRVWPLLDFQSAIEDHLQGHSCFETLNSLNASAEQVQT